MGLGSFVSGILGSKNENKAVAPKIDPNAYQYGGAPGGADAAANRYQAQAQGAQARQGVQMNTGQMDETRAAGVSALGRQGQATDLAMSAAQGNAPSAAAIQQQQGVEAAMRSQMAMAAGARGNAALAGAQYNAAQNTGNLQQSAVNDAARLRADEMATARGQALQGTAGLSSAAQGMRGLDYQQAAGQAGFDAQQRALNDQMTQGMTQNEMAVHQAQLNAQMQMQAQQSSNSLGAQQIQQKTDESNSGRNQQNGMFAIGAASSAAGAASGALSDERQKMGVQDASGKGRLLDAVQDSIDNDEGQWQRLAAQGNAMSAQQAPAAAAPGGRPLTGDQMMVLDMAKPAYGVNREATDPRISQVLGAAGAHAPVMLVAAPKSPGLFGGAAADEAAPAKDDAFGQGQAFGRTIGKFALGGASSSGFGNGAKLGDRGVAVDGPDGGSMNGISFNEFKGDNTSMYHPNAKPKMFEEPSSSTASTGAFVKSDERVKTAVRNAAYAQGVKEGAKASGPQSTVDLSQLSPAEWEEYKSASDRIAGGKGSGADASYVVRARSSAPQTVQSPTLEQEAIAERDAPIPRGETRMPMVLAAPPGKPAPHAAQPVVVAEAPRPSLGEYIRDIAGRAAYGSIPAVVMNAVRSSGAGPTVANAERPAAAVVSDERAKGSVRRAEPAKFLDSLTTYAYNYKPGVGEDPSTRRFGPMAQDVERTPMGASIVVDTPEGKVLDTKHGFGVALGALGNLNDRLRLLEGERRKKAG